MAASVTSESILGTIIQGHLECSICCTCYQDPKMLHCSHSFCLKCLQELQQRQCQDSTMLTCPLCQRETTLPEGGVTKLTNNYHLISLMEEVTQQEQLVQGQGSKVICPACDEENEAISRCLDCEHNLCQECQRAHTRMVNMKTHTVTALAELPAEDSAFKSESKYGIPKCEIHPSQDLCIYCVTCEKLICKLCAPLNHKEPMHSSVDFKMAMAICVQDAQDMFSQLDKCSALKETRTSTNLVSLRNRLSTMLTTTKSHISQKAEAEMAKIKHREIQLLQQAQTTFKQKDKKLAKMVFFEHAMKRIHSGMTADSCYQILKFRQELLQAYKDVCEEHTSDVTRNLSFIGFKECEGGLGTLLLEEKWELMSEIKVTGKSIASFSSGNIVVVDNGQIKRITILGSNCQPLCTENIDNLQNPTRIAVNKDDHLLILDSPTVKIFNEENRLLHQFTPGKESDSTPTCLAVDNSNLIAVGYQDKGEISLHNPDGSLIKTLPASMIAGHMTINNKRLIYTNHKNKKLICIDFMGNELWTANTDNDSSPYEVCCGRAGDMYVFSCCKKNNQVHHYSAEGDYIGPVINDLTGYTHYAMTHTPDDKLAMTGHVSTRIYCRV